MWAAQSFSRREPEEPGKRIDESDELGKMLQSTVEESKPDTDSIKAAIQHEEEVPGAELRRGWHLRIK